MESVGEEEKWWAAWRAEGAPAFVENESADVESRETGEPSMMAVEGLCSVRELGEHARIQTRDQSVSQKPVPSEVTSWQVYRVLPRELANDNCKVESRRLM